MRRRRRGSEQGTTAPAPGAQVDELLATGILDRRHYEAQTALTFAADRAAAGHYVAEGAAAGLTPHPLLDRASLPARVDERLAIGRVLRLVTYVRQQGHHRPLGPLFDGRVLDVAGAHAGDHPGGALGRFLASAEDDTPLPGCPGLTLGGAREALRRQASEWPGPATPSVDWTAVRAAVGGRVPGRTSVVVPARGDVSVTTIVVTNVLREVTDGAVEVVVVDAGSSRPESAWLFATSLRDERVSYVRVPAGHPMAASRNVGIARSTGALVLFLDDDTVPRAGWLAPLLSRLEPGVLGVQPLLQRPDDSIASAGLVFPADDTLPCEFLAGHPPEDARRLAGGRFPAVGASALLMRAEDLAALEGFDPLLVGGVEAVDLCLRAAAQRPGAFVVEPSSLMTCHRSRSADDDEDVLASRRLFLDRWRGRLPACEPQRWTEVGFELLDAGRGETPVTLPQPVVVRPSGDPAVLRWGVKLPSPGGEAGARWGDTHFAESLATALRGIGQEVVTHRRGAHTSRASGFDDVALGIRGLEVIHPVPGKVNVLWVISHPDDVTVAEVQGFDLVFAASASWATEMTARSGREVGVLLQATDLSRRADMTLPVGSGAVPVFVGATFAHRPRPIVADAVTAGVPFLAFGPWQGKVPDTCFGGAYIPNDQLMALYRAHGLVLADHHEDMAAHGFAANRLYDAVASGARVVSDWLPGLEAFEGAVQSYRSPEELALLCSAEGRSRFPDDEQMAEIADRVAREHSFDRRAEQLLAAVRRVADEASIAQPSRRRM